jgi:hypothetical protein
MSTLNVFKAVSMTLVAAAVCVSLQAHATTVNTVVNFSAASQSMWGPDGPSVLGYSGSASWDLPLGLGTETFGYGFVANAGTVMGNASGSLVTNYTPVMSAPGVANIGLQFDSGTGSLTSEVNASATLTFFSQTFGPSVGLIVNNNFSPSAYGVQWLGITADDIANPSVDLTVASAGLDFGVTQFNHFTPTGIDGTLFYQREGSSVVQSQAFNLATGATLPVNLSQAGTYDFWFGNDWDFLNQFYSSTSLGLTASASTAVGCGSDLLESCHWDATLANPTIYTGDPFALNFDAWAQPTSFQIEVQPVPVPHGLGLATLGGGVLLLGIFDGRRRRRARTPKDF